MATRLVNLSDAVTSDFNLEAVAVLNDVSESISHQWLLLPSTS